MQKFTVPKDFDRDAPGIAHAKLDRLWLVREEEGCVTISTNVMDPEDPTVEYGLTLSLERLS